jgi:hypothetical protein
MVAGTCAVRFFTGIRGKSSIVTSIWVEKKNVTREIDKLVSQKESVRNRHMLESKVESWRNYLCLLASKTLNFEDEISLRGVDCNIPRNFK